MVTIPDWFRDFERDLFEIYFPPDREMDIIDDACFSLAISPVTISKILQDQEPDELKSLLQGELYERYPMQLARSETYAKIFKRWHEEVDREDPSQNYMNRTNLFHVYAPTFLQELESHFSYNLAVFIDLLISYRTGRGDWQDRFFTNDNPESFHHLLDQTIDQVDLLEEKPAGSIKLGLRFLQQDPEFLSELGIDAEFIPKISQIRNSIAHGDYVVKIKENNSPVIEFRTNGGIVSTKLVQALIWMKTSARMIRSFSVGIAISLFRAAEVHDRPDKAYRIIDAYVKDEYPPEQSIWPGGDSWDDVNGPNDFNFEGP